MSCVNRLGETAERIKKNGANPILPDCKRKVPSFGMVDEQVTVIEEIFREIQEFNRDFGIQGRLPTSLELKMAGRSDLVRIIRANGGFVKIANCIGLRYVPQPRLTSDQWNEFQKVVSGVWEYMNRKHLSDRMPLHRELIGDGLFSLAKGIIRYGGFRYVANWMGIAYESHPDRRA